MATHSNTAATRPAILSKRTRLKNRVPGVMAASLSCFGELGTIVPPTRPDSNRRRFEVHRLSLGERTFATAKLALASIVAQSPDRATLLDRRSPGTPAGRGDL